MSLQHFKESYYQFSGTASTVCRQLSFAGIAIVWIFKTNKGEDVGVYGLPEALLWPVVFLICSMALDLIQYVVQTIIWSFYHRIKEKELRKASKGDEEEFLSLARRLTAPPQLNWPGWSLFTLKILSMIIAYGLLLKYAASVITFS